MQTSREINSDHNTKTLGFAFGRSAIAKKLGYRHGCYYVSTGTINEPEIDIINGSMNHGLAQYYADKIDLPYTSIDGVIQDGTKEAEKIKDEGWPYAD